MVREMLPTVKPAPVDSEVSSQETWFAEKGEGKEKGMETDPPSSGKKSRHKGKTNKKHQKI
jgi:hypothetical protein